MKIFFDAKIFTTSMTAISRLSHSRGQGVLLGTSASMQSKGAVSRVGFRTHGSDPQGACTHLFSDLIKELHHNRVQQHVVKDNFDSVDFQIFLMTGPPLLRVNIQIAVDYWPTETW